MKKINRRESHIVFCGAKNSVGFFFVLTLLKVPVVFSYPINTNIASPNYSKSYGSRRLMKYFSG